MQVPTLSRLYESAPAYVTDQPAFLNAAAIIETTLDPITLLKTFKDIEQTLGRDFSAQRWGPRPIDLDVIFYEDHDIQHDDRHLIVPHPRWQERDFVKAPLADLIAWHSSTSINSLPHHHFQPSSSGLDRRLALARDLWLASGGERQLGTPSLSCVMPMGRLGLWNWQSKTHVMGILNVTPDSFSDGSLYYSNVPTAVHHACEMVLHGADIIDIGGQSTRPGASHVTPEDEIARILPVIHALKNHPHTRAVPLSVDTFTSKVAAAAVDAGATMVNDVSGGTLDSHMHDTVAQLGVPYVLMHMRGTPGTMQSAENTTYNDNRGGVCGEVAAVLQEQGEHAVRAGIEPWRLVLDPGLGFAKTEEGNVELIARLHDIKCMLRPPLQGVPWLLGPSRKGFLGKLTGKTSNPEERDWATASAAALCSLNGANIIRAHNVEAVKDAVRVADAVRSMAL